MNFAIIENGTVINIMVADSKTVAEELTGLTCVELSDEQSATVGGTYDGSNFITIKPYPSWTLQPDLSWAPPTPCPTNEDKPWAWNEETLSWEVLTPSE
jgi:hypothetical protein